MFKKLTLILALSCISITGLHAAYGENTLGENSAVPNALIESQVDENTAGALLNTPYKGFYQINSKFRNKKITFTKVKEKKSFPDQRWTSLAKSIANLAESEAFTTGSRISPRAKAYVAFYDVNSMDIDRSKITHLTTSIDGKPNTLAVLFIEHKNRSKSKSAIVGNNSGKSSTIYFFELAL
ncbi:MAG: hypothetical protein JKY88_13500 [Pseudomonadales bacterium]|nr:hypothetical protein [Pseudomonadales bacterium]